MAEIPKEELEAPQKITEGAILELINLWLMDYKPDDTVDPSSTRPVTAKAVSSMIGTPVRIYNLKFSDGIYKRNIEDVKFKIGSHSYIEFEIFTGSGQYELDDDSTAYMYSLDSGRRILMDASVYVPDPTRYGAGYNHTHTLNWIEVKQGYSIDDKTRGVISFINRFVYINNRGELVIDKAYRSYVSGDYFTQKDVNIWTRRNPATDNQQIKTQPYAIVFYKH